MDRKRIPVYVLLACVCFSVSGQAADWPQWRYDSGHTAGSPEPLGNRLQLRWERKLPAVEPCWPKQPRLSFDACYHPIVMDGVMYVPSMVSDSVTALDAKTGEKIWRFHAEGPVRFAPAGWKGRVYFVSDDGFLYCVDASNGTLNWKVRGLPAWHQERRVLGNGRLISMWPTRGGPVVVDDTVYFAAGIWPNDGIYIHAVDADSGRIRWTNSDTGLIPKGMKDHNGIMDGGFSPQGYLTVVDDYLVVPNGNAMPGLLDRSTGKRIPTPAFWGGRGGLEKGTWFTAGNRGRLFVGGDLYDLSKLATNRSDKERSRMLIDPANFKDLGHYRMPVLDGDMVYASTPAVSVPVFPAVGKPAFRAASDGNIGLQAWRIPARVPEPPSMPRSAKSKRHSEQKPDLSSLPPIQKQHPVEDPEWRKTPFNLLTPVWDQQSDLRIHIKSGSRLYASAPGKIVALDIGKPDSAPEIVWEAAVSGSVSEMLTASGWLYVVTDKGMLGYGPPAPDKGIDRSSEVGTTNDSPTFSGGSHKEIVAASVDKEGYCILLGADLMALGEAIRVHSKMRIILFDADPAAVNGVRQALDAKGVSRTRFSVYQGSGLDMRLPPFLGSLVVAGESMASRITGKPSGMAGLSRLLHPYQGELWLPTTPAVHAMFTAEPVAGQGGMSLARVGSHSRFKRSAAPAGFGGWTHINADSAGSRVGNDTTVQGRLGILWFGGEIDNIFPEWDFTHARTIPPLVCDGRMFVQIPPLLHAVDVYTGRPLWHKNLGYTEFETVAEGKKAFKWYRPRSHIYAAYRNRIYVVTRPQTISGHMVVNPSDKKGNACLVLDARDGRTLKTFNSPDGDGWRDIKVDGESLAISTAKSVVMMSRKTGVRLWEKKSDAEVMDFVLAGNQVLMLDASNPGFNPERRGRGGPREEAHLVALDKQSGRELWRAGVELPKSHSGAVLAYSRSNRLILVVAGNKMVCYREEGSMAWKTPLTNKKEFSNLTDRGAAASGRTRPLLYPEYILSPTKHLFSWKDGSPLSGTVGIPAKTRGCTEMLGSIHLITGRDGHAIIVDREQNVLQNLIGVRVGCSNSLIPACGVVSAPYYSQGCSCNYPLPTSFCLVPVPRL